MLSLASRASDPDPEFLGMRHVFGVDQLVKFFGGQYAKPDGRLFIAYSDEKLAGCIALRKRKMAFVR